MNVGVTDTPREGQLHLEIPLQDMPLLVPPRSTETAENTMLMDALVSNLIHTVQRQTSLIEEQNRHLTDLEQARIQKQAIPSKRTPSSTHDKGGGSPRQSRSRSPRHSINMRSPCRKRRSLRRRSPRWSPTRRSPPRCKDAPGPPFRSEDDRDARSDRNAYDPFT